MSVLEQTRTYVLVLMKLNDKLIQQSSPIKDMRKIFTVEQISCLSKTFPTLLVGTDERPSGEGIWDPGLWTVEQVRKSTDWEWLTPSRQSS